MRRISKPPTPLTIARITAGLRQSDLAEGIGKSTAYIHRLETGGPAILTPEIAERIAAAVKTPSFILFAGSKK